MSQFTDIQIETAIGLADYQPASYFTTLPGWGGEIRIRITHTPQHAPTEEWFANCEGCSQRMGHPYGVGAPTMADAVRKFAKYHGAVCGR